MTSLFAFSLSKIGCRCSTSCANDRSSERVLDFQLQSEIRSLHMEWVDGINDAALFQSSVTHVGIHAIYVTLRIAIE